MDLGLLVLRGALGTAMVLQGWGKIRPDRRADTIAYFRRIGFEPAARLAPVTGTTEAIAGLLLVVGLATPLAGAGTLAVLVGAVAVNRVNGWSAASGGAEYPVTLGLVSLAVILTGPGAASLDAALGREDVSLSVSLGAAVAGVAATLPLLVRRERALRRAGSAAAVPSTRSLEVAA